MSMKEFAKSLIIRRLEYYLDDNMYVDDIAYKVTEKENVDGSIWCDAKHTLDFIIENLNEAREFVYRFEDNFREPTPNPLIEPEKFSVLFLIDAVEQLVWNSEVLQKANEDSEYSTIAITEDLIVDLKAEFDRM